MTKQVARDVTTDSVGFQDAVMFSIIAVSCSRQCLSSHLSRNEMINSISSDNAANYLERSRSLPPHLAGARLRQDQQINISLSHKSY